MINWIFNRKALSPNETIEIDGETYLADLSGEQTTALNLQENALPVQVELNWKKDENACLDNKITVTDIKRQKAYNFLNFACKKNR